MWEDVRCEKMWEDVRCEKMSDVRRCEKMWEDVRRCEMWEDVRCEKMWEDVRCEKMSDVRGCEKMWDVRRCEKISHVRRSFICRSIYTSFFLKNPSLRRSRELHIKFQFFKNIYWVPYYLAIHFVVSQAENKFIYYKYAWISPNFGEHIRPFYGTLVKPP